MISADMVLFDFTNIITSNYKTKKKSISKFLLSSLFREELDSNRMNKRNEILQNLAGKKEEIS